MAADTLSVPSPRSDFYRSCGLSTAIVAANTQYQEITYISALKY